VTHSRTAPTRRRRTGVTAFAVLASVALLLGACGDGGGTASEPQTAPPTTAAPCPVEPVDVVVSVNQWGDIVDDLAGECANVTTIFASSTADPHDFEPGPADAAKFQGAELVVYNGLFYDDWARRAADALPTKPQIVDAGAVVGLAKEAALTPGADDPDVAAKDDDGHSHGGKGHSHGGKGHSHGGKGHSHGDEKKAEGASNDGHGHGGVNPHIWYSPDYVKTVATAVTTKLKETSPGAAAYFDERAADWTTSMQPYFDEVQAIRAGSAGTAFASTESVFDYMGDATGLSNVTPEGYRDAAANETDPAPADIAAFDTVLRSGTVKVLVFNPQTSGAVTDQLRSTAESAGVPVVEMTETVPQGATSFADWQITQLQALSKALTGGSGSDPGSEKSDTP
jgi:zinc/manganese transport system substrate-binding protein